MGANASNRLYNALIPPKYYFASDNNKTFFDVNLHYIYSAPMLTIPSNGHDPSPNDELRIDHANYS